MMSIKRQNNFLNLYEPIHDKFDRFCRARAYGEMDAQDLMNETLMVAFEKLDELKSDKAFFSFLCGISIRILSNAARKKQASFKDLGAAENLYDQTSETEKNFEVEMLHKCLSKLPDIQRECIILFEISGFSINEIATIQNSSISAIKQRLKRGRERLEEILKFEVSYKVEGAL